MAILKILIWRDRDAVGEPEVEVRVPSSMAKWIPKLMAFVPEKKREEIWGEDVNLGQMFSDVEQVISEAKAGGLSEIVDVKTKEGRVKVTIE